MKYLLLFLFPTFVALQSCNNSSRNEVDHQTRVLSEGENEDEKYPDGEYCASITYHNPNTGTESTYTLTVEVENNEVTVIHWPNGGWLDATHFTPEQLDENGSVSFTSDKGYEYTVEIESEGPCSYSSQNSISAEDEEDIIQEQEEENTRLHKGEEEGVVIWDHSRCDYVVISTNGGWYVVAEKGIGVFMLGRGSRVRGNLTTFGYEDVYSFSDDDEINIYIDNYYGSKGNALQRVIEKCHLNDEEE